MSEIAIEAENISKYYRLGQINNGTLYADIQSWFARKLGKEDPHAKIGFDSSQSDQEGFWALKDINFEIKQGDRVGIIGRNGAGKSTLLKVISEITKPTTGDLYIKGRVASLLEVGTGFHPEMTGRENIYMNGSILGMKKAEITRHLDEIIAFSELEKYIDTPVKRYSSGMYVRLAFAVAAHLDSEILIADEVLAVGDAAFQKKALGKMNELSTGQGRTVLFVSHQMNAVKNLCNKGIVLEKGECVRTDDDIGKSIEWYLGYEMTKREDTTTWVNDGSLKNDYFRIDRIEVVDDDDKVVTSALNYNSGYKIKLTFTATKKTLNSIRFNFSFYKNTEYLFAVGIPDDSRFDEGMYNIYFPLNTSLFYEGEYLAVASGSITNVSWIVPPNSFDIGIRFKVCMKDSDKKWQSTVISKR